jgi:hypothetical protein
LIIINICLIAAIVKVLTQNITYAIIAITTFLNLCIATAIVVENATLHKEQETILSLYLGGGIAKHVVRKGKIQAYPQIKREL